ATGGPPAPDAPPPPIPPGPACGRPTARPRPARPPPLITACPARGTHCPRRTRPAHLPPGNGAVSLVE
ncbi:MAG: hypothetical protein RMK84_19335, partial [Oscillochloridaceae bacterium]|nr:hypothetical protein [Chloroflexaceae bacterium]MDW8392280.1 hypothetical protein [Oscillochloridaceae bacterium]